MEIRSLNLQAWKKVGPIDAHTFEQFLSADPGKSSKPLRWTIVPVYVLLHICINMLALSEYLAARCLE